MDITRPPLRRRDLIGAIAGPKWLTRLTGRRNVMVATTVLVVLALATWAMIDFYGDRLSPLPRTGNPMPDLSTRKADGALEAELAQVTAILTRRDVDDELLVEAVYNTPELFAALSRREAAHEGGGETESESLLQKLQRNHRVDRYLVFTLTLGSSGPDLKDYRPEVTTRLRTASGREAPVESWIELSSPTSDHHRIGLLHFSRATVDGQSLLSEDDGWLELVLSAPDGRERVLRWELPIAYPSVPTT